MDEKIRKALNEENLRQQNNLELIASENYVSKSILELQGSILTNKYAEGYPGKRYYGGCEYVDEIETLAIEYAKKLFGAKYANVQPHSGSSANLAVYRALLEPGDKILGMALQDGGHLSHGSKFNFSGLDYEVVSYTVDEVTEMLDYEEIRKLAKQEKPKMIIAGASSYPRAIDFKKFREIADEVGAILMVDMAHIAGLVAGGVHQNPVQYADVVTSTTHKTLRGPRGGFILTNREDIIKKINKTVFPGVQGGPLMHVIAAKAQCFKEALSPSFKKYVKAVVENTQALIEVFKFNHWKIITDGSDNHLVLVDVKDSLGITGEEAEKVLERVNITVNKNKIPGDDAKSFSGIRIGTAAMTSRGLGREEFSIVGMAICMALIDRENMDTIIHVRTLVEKITDAFPIQRY